MRLLRPVQQRLERFARGMARDREEARDLVSETLLRAYERFEQIENQEAFLQYLLTICRRCCSAGWKRRKYRGAYNEAEANAQRDRDAGPELTHDIQALYAALAGLPRKQREALVMFELSGLSLAEIRTLQGGSLSGVKSRLARARKKLVKLLGAESKSSAAPAQGFRQAQRGTNGTSKRRAEGSPGAPAFHTQISGAHDER